MNLPSGIIPILPTPFTADDRIDVAALRGLVDFAVEAGAAGVGTPAFGSEFYKLDAAERTEVIETVLSQAANRLPVIVQCNHTSPRVAARLAADAAKRGASAINTALPRAFAVSTRQLEDFAREVCDAVALPVIVQDWNPSGESVDAAFAVRLHRRCGNFRALKLEEPGIGPVIRAIGEETAGHVGVYSGWGGLHLLELQPAGARGAMPGLAVADVLARVWNLGAARRDPEAFALFASVSPYLQFSLQTFEQFHHAAKRLQVERGLLKSAAVRSVTIELGEDAGRYLDWLLVHLQPMFNVPRAAI